MMSYIYFVFYLCRNPEYYEEEHLRTTPDVNIAHTAHRMGGSSDNFDTPSVSQTDMLKQEATEVGQANQYSFPSSSANYAFENSQQLNPSFANSQASSQMQGLPFSSVMVSILQALLSLTPYRRLFINIKEVFGD